MTFSIIIPTYNGADFLRFAIESALNQTRAADEIIVSDDNSTDSTLSIAAEYGDHIKIYKNENGPSGFVNGWNNAIKHASCEYVSILHQDDCLHPDFLNEVEKAIELHPDVGHIFAPCNNIDKDGNEIQEALECDGSIKRLSGHEYIDLYLNHGEPHIHRCPGVVTRKDLFAKCQYREEAGHIADDDFFMRIGNYTDIIGIMKPLASYRIHQNSETGHLSALNIEKRLARDWHFQCCHAKENPLITKEILRQIRNIRYGDAKHVIGYSLKQLDFSSLIYGFKYILGLPKL